MQMLMIPGQPTLTTQHSPISLHIPAKTLGGGFKVIIAKPAAVTQRSDCRMSAARLGSVG